MASGYSGTPLAKKLGIKPGHTVVAVNAPADLSTLLEPLPEAAQVVTDAPSADVSLLFCLNLETLQSQFSGCRSTMTQSGGLWVCWPKKASKVKTDLTGDVVREFGLATGLVDNKVCAIDTTWSALRFVIRLTDR